MPRESARRLSSRRECPRRRSTDPGDIPFMTEGPLAAYRATVRDGAIKPDPMQALAAEKLESLHHALRHYQPASGVAGWRARLGLARRPDPAPQGLYLYGGVGRGKSMLMDLFFRTAPVEAKRSPDESRVGQECGRQCRSRWAPSH